MKKISKIFAMALIALTVFCLASCGGTGGGGKTDGDVIEIKEKHKSAQRYKDILEVTSGRLTPAWLESDLENLKVVVKEVPTREMIDVPVDEMLIVELYSK